MHIPTPLIVAVTALVLLGVAASLVRLLGRQQAAQPVACGYEAVPALLTPAERSFFGVLEQAVASDYQIFPRPGWPMLCGLFGIRAGVVGSQPSIASLASTLILFSVIRRVLAWSR